MSEKTLFNIATIFAFLGLADASYLTYLKVFSLPIPCSLADGCETVIRSSYSVVFGVPLAVWGLVFYGVMLLISIVAIYKPTRLVRKLFSAGVTVGLLCSAYFFYLQAFVIRAWCQYCLFSIFTSTCLFIIGAYICKKFSQME